MPGRNGRRAARHQRVGSPGVQQEALRPVHLRKAHQRHEEQRLEAGNVPQVVHVLDEPWQHHGGPVGLVGGGGRVALRQEVEQRGGLREGHADVQAHLCHQVLELLACVFVLRAAEAVVDRQPVQNPAPTAPTSYCTYCTYCTYWTYWTYLLQHLLHLLGLHPTAPTSYSTYWITLHLLDQGLALRHQAHWCTHSCLVLNKRL
jgi:hypothetical protein